MINDQRDNCVQWWCRWYVDNNWRSYCKGVRAENHEQESEPRWAPSEHSQRRGEACFHQFTILMISCRWQTSGWVGVLEEQKDLQRLNIVNPTYERHQHQLWEASSCSHLWEAFSRSHLWEAPLKWKFLHEKQEQVWFAKSVTRQCNKAVKKQGKAPQWGRMYKHCRNLNHLIPYPTPKTAKHSTKRMF